MVTGARKARLKPREAHAASKHWRDSCTQAPRPATRRSGSGTTRPSTVAKRRSTACGARTPQPTQVRIGADPAGSAPCANTRDVTPPPPAPTPARAPGPAGPGVTRPRGPVSGRADDVRVLALERLMAVEAAIARARQRGGRATAPVGEDRLAATAHGLGLLLAVAAFGLVL